MDDLDDCDKSQEDPYEAECFVLDNACQLACKEFDLYLNLICERFNSRFPDKKIEKEDPERAHRLADEIIKNTYRTLMTRGMKGCYVYATDPGLREYLKTRTGENTSYAVVDITD